MESGVAQAITFVIGNLGVLLVIVALIVAFIRVRWGRGGPGTAAADVFLQELILYGVGVSWVLTGGIHAFGNGVAARDIGWQPSPFEVELGILELGVAVVAILSRWRTYDMRLAVAMIFAIFSFGAAAQHIYFIVCCGNVHPGNAGTILWLNDIALPIAILVLAWIAGATIAGERSRVGRQ